MEHYYKILDSENGVAACHIEEMPEKYREDIEKQGGELTTLTFYFDKEHDLIVLNEDNKEYMLYADIVLSMMSSTDEVLIGAFEKLPDSTKAVFRNVFTILISVMRYRALKAGDRHAEE